MAWKKLSSLNDRDLRPFWLKSDRIITSFSYRSAGWLIPAICGFLTILSPACTESDLPSDDNATDHPLPPTFGNLGLESDPFENAATKDSQLAVLHALFDPKTGYRLPGTYDKAKLEALFLDIRAGYFVKTEGIDEHIRREYHTFTHAIDIVVTIHGLLRATKAFRFLH